MEAKTLTTNHFRRHLPETSLLYKTVAANLATFIAQREADGRGLPPHVIKELRAFLRCGILHYGFMRVKCSSCTYEAAVAYSCKKRGFCPSCGGKRMAETAEHLCENVLPHVDYRQYVVSLPIPLRYWCATNKRLTSLVHTYIKKTLLSYFERKAKALGIENPLPGGITFIQRAGSALNLNIHFHILCMEGVYTSTQTDDPRAKPKFITLPPPTDDEIGDIVQQMADKIIALVRKRGYLAEEGEEIETPPLDDVFAEHPSYTQAVAASIRGRLAFGPHGGERVRKIGSGFGHEDETPMIQGPKCATVNGFSLHANTFVGRAKRDQLRRLVKYMARPPVASSRLKEGPSRRGELLYELKSQWRDGTTAISLTPMELLEKLTALVPPGRSHLVRHWGVFGCHSRWRSQIVLKPEKRKGFAPDLGYDPKKVKNTRWAKMLAKTFGVDVSVCPDCGGELRIMAMINDHSEVARYLSHMGLSAQPPPIAGARYEQQEFDWEGDGDPQEDGDDYAQQHPDYDHY